MSLSRKETLGYGVSILVLASAAVVYLTPVRFLRGRSVSMEPVLHDGDGIIVGPSSWDGIETGEIIAFRHGGTVIAHEIVGFENGKIVTHGVNMPSGDVETVEPFQVIGVHVLTVPKAGVLLDYVDSLLGFVLLILVPTALIVLNEARKIREEIRSDRE